MSRKLPARNGSGIKVITRAAALRDLQRIPGIGPSLARDLADLGIRRVTDLRRRNPERLYEQLSELRGQPMDRCVLYVFRCAVYFASTPRPEPERLKWWNWKDGGLACPHPSTSTPALMGQGTPRMNRKTKAE